MSLILRFQTTGRVPGNAQPVQMRGQNLTVGRSPDNDLVLPDPDRTISKRHCVLEERAGQFVVIDVSSNGTFLNYAKEPLGPELHPVHDGDILSIGPYEMIVGISVETDASAVAEAPSPMTPQAQPAPAAIDPMPSDSAGDLLDDLLGGLDGPGGGAGVAPLIPDDADDDLLGGLPSLDPIQERAAPTPFTPQAQGGVSGQNFAPASPGSGLIPDDWDLSLGGDEATPEPPRPVGGPFGGSPTQPKKPLRDEASERRQGAEPPSPATAPTPDPTPPAEAPASHAPEPVVASPPEPIQAEATPVAPTGGQTPPNPPQPISRDNAMAFLDALGVDCTRLPEGELDEIMARLGSTMRALIVGVREILMTRTAIKGEFRMGQTVIRSTGNNPLKFSISEDEAVERMTRQPSKGYMAPDAAVEEALRDIRAHEIAMVSGMQAALAGLLAEFDPEKLAAKLAESGRSGGLLKSKKSQYWEIFEETYATISDQAENEFHDLFTREFAQAYQSQLEKLK